jgi:hypothetical protein
MAAKFPYDRDGAVRRGASLSAVANVKGAMAKAIRRRAAVLAPQELRVLSVPP